MVRKRMSFLHRLLFAVSVGCAFWFASLQAQTVDQKISATILTNGQWLWADSLLYTQEGAKGQISGPGWTFASGGVCRHGGSGPPSFEEGRYVVAPDGKSMSITPVRWPKQEGVRLIRQTEAVDYSDYLVFGDKRQMVAVHSKVAAGTRLKLKGEAVTTMGGVVGRVIAKSLTLRSGPGATHAPVQFTVYAEDPMKGTDEKSSSLKDGQLVIVWARTDRRAKLYGKEFAWLYVQRIGRNGAEGDSNALLEKAWVYGEFIKLE